MAPWLSVVLLAAPVVTLGAQTDCRDELIAAGFSTAQRTERELWLDHGVLVIRHGEAIELRRKLGPVSCHEASLAAVAIYERWVTGLGRVEVPEKARLPQVTIAPTRRLPARRPAALKRGQALLRTEPQAAAGPPSTAPPLVTVALLDEDAGVARENPADRIGTRPDGEDAGTEVASLSAATKAMTPARALSSRDAGVEQPLEGAGRERFSTDSGVTEPREAPVRERFSTDSGVTEPREVPVGERFGADSGVTQPPDGPAARIGTRPVAEAPADVTLPAPTAVPAVSSPVVELTDLEALAGGGLSLPGAPTTFAPVLSVDLALVLNDALRISLAGLFDFGGSVDVLDSAGRVRGTLATRGGLVLPRVAWCFPTTLRLCLGVEAGARLAGVTVSGDFLFQQRQTVAARFTGGPSVQLTWRPGRFRLALDGALWVSPVPLDFTVEALPTALKFPVFQGVLRLSIGVGGSRE